MLSYILRRLAKIHAFGYRSRALGNSGVFIVGRNWMVFPLLVMFGGGLALTVWIMLPHPELDPWENPVIVVMMLILFLLCVFAIYYGMRGLSVRTEIMFSDNSLSRTQHFLIGSKVKYFDYADIESIRFTTLMPHGSFFKVVRIGVVPRDGDEIPLLQKDSPMYSWQGKKVYHRLKKMLAANNREALLGPEPDFSWEGDAGYKKLFSPNEHD